VRSLTEKENISMLVGKKKINQNEGDKKQGETIDKKEKVNKN